MHGRVNHHQRGMIVVELAMVAPLLMLMMVGAADFSRVFYHAIEVSNASGTSAFYGSGSTVRAASTAVIEEIAQEDAGDLSGVTVTSSSFCDCPDNTTGLSGAVSCVDTTCAGFGLPRVYSRVTVQQSFELLIPWPGVPNPVTLSRESFFRVQ